MQDIIPKKHNFHTNLFEKNSISEVFERIVVSKTNKTIYQAKDNKTPQAYIYSVQLLPDYINTSLKTPYHNIKVFQKLGYAVNLDGYKDVNDYLKTNCTTNFKKNVLRSIKRLESCFNITYKIYFGSMEFENYTFLMQCLYNMLVSRFQQRQGRNRVIENWDYYTNLAYKLILERKASLFVIYNETEPIEISLDFHYEMIISSAMSSYNLDYSKFSLGNVEIYKQLEWCIENNFMLFDMAYGDLDYKKSWSNTIYNFENHIISTPNNMFALWYGKYLKLKYRFINYLIAKNIIESLRQVLKLFKKKENNTLHKSISYSSSLVDNDERFDLENIEILNINSNPFIKKPINDFLYSNNEHLNDIKVFKIKNEPNAFLIKGKNKSLRVVLTNN